MSVSRGFDVFYSDLDILIGACVQPILLRHRKQFPLLYWERHFAGGPHLRLRARGRADRVAALSDELVPALERFLRDRPSSNLPRYSAERAADLLRREGSSVETAGELAYRNNYLVTQEHPSGPENVPTPEAKDLLESFQHDAMPLAGRILNDPRPRREVMARIFFLHALVVAGDLPQGSVSWRSHWEGFASTTPSEDALHRIRSTYTSRRRLLRDLMVEVQNFHEAEAWTDDPVLASWRDLLLTYRPRIRRILQAGSQLTRQPATLEEAKRFRERMKSEWLRETAFLETLSADDTFLTSIQREQRILVPRVLVNLLYVLHAAVGLSPIDKFILCYFTHRTVEEHFGCDLREVLERNVEQIAGRRSLQQPT